MYRLQDEGVITREIYQLFGEIRRAGNEANHAFYGDQQKAQNILKVADAEQGSIITPSDFTPEAKAEAQSTGKTPITLISGAELVDLLIKYQVGIKQEQVVVPSIDTEYWTEVVGITLEEPKEKVKVKVEKPTKNIRFPLSIQGKHKDEIYKAELLNLNGTVCLNGQEYPTPTTAAKVIVTDWKEVNGWDFWRYENLESGKLEKIGNLRITKK